MSSLRRQRRRYRLAVCWRVRRRFAAANHWVRVLFFWNWTKRQSQLNHAAADADIASACEDPFASDGCRSRRRASKGRRSGPTPCASRQLRREESRLTQHVRPFRYQRQQHGQSERTIASGFSSPRQGATASLRRLPVRPHDLVAYEAEPREMTAQFRKRVLCNDVPSAVRKSSSPSASLRNGRAQKCEGPKRQIALIW